VRGRGSGAEPDCGLPATGTALAMMPLASAMSGGLLE
jgi:hypothetical protein